MEHQLLNNFYLVLLGGQRNQVLIEQHGDECNGCITTGLIPDFLLHKPIPFFLIGPVIVTTNRSVGINNSTSGLARLGLYWNHRRFCCGYNLQGLWLDILVLSVLYHFKRHFIPLFTTGHDKTIAVPAFVDEDRIGRTLPLVIYINSLNFTCDSAHF